MLGDDVFYRARRRGDGEIILAQRQATYRWIDRNQGLHHNLDYCATGFAINHSDGR